MSWWQQCRDWFRRLAPDASAPLCDDDLMLVMRRHQKPKNPDDGLAFEFDMHRMGDRRRVGRISLRTGNTTRIVRYLGHVGYFVEPEHRGHHYARNAIRLLLPLAWRHQVNPLWITCNPDNLASRRSIEQAGGIYVETVPVPPDDPLYDQGDVEKCRFRFSP